MEEKGTISIHSENIFPIIKKFLYSDSEIFLRELVSNAVDATQKIKHLATTGEYGEELGDIKVVVKLDEEAKTITISDKGIGMTADEIKKYINQIAFSGATEFVEKYKDAKDANQIIGHFGLGFYSAFMVADTVEINTKSYQKDTSPAKWVCDGSTEFEINDGSREERGTDIILNVGEEGKEFLDKFRLKGILEKYCKFLPVEIEFDGEVINDPNPIWVKSPSELKDQDYIDFYKKLYPFSEDPLFWIHLNVDYPFNLTGVLYFPKLKENFDFQKNKIQLYSRQVFITDEVKDVVPEFLMLLHGVIDSPDIPLNVSRSFLQADSNVRKINAHITKKVADKLNDIFKADRKAYEEKWKDINVFVKYGLISEDKFYDKAAKVCLLTNTEGQHFSIEEYKEKIATLQKDKEDNVVALYASNVGTQDTYIQSAKNKGYDVLVLDEVIDSHFVNLMEQKHEKFQFKRVDSDVADKLIEKEEKLDSVLSEEEKTAVKEVFEKAIDDKKYNVAVEAMAADELPVSITMPEFMRRMSDMSAAGGNMMFGAMPENYSVAVNGNHEVVKAILEAKSDAKKQKLAKQAFDIGMLSKGMLQGSELTAFVKRSVDFIK